MVLAVSVGVSRSSGGQLAMLLNLFCQTSVQLGNPTELQLDLVGGDFVSLHKKEEEGMKE